MSSIHEIKKTLGIQLGYERLKQKRTLFAVAQETNIPPHILDKVELGMYRGWRTYHKLIDYYHCEIKLENMLLKTPSNLKD